MNLINFLIECDCGGVILDDTISSLIKTVYNVIRIGIPLILIVVGMIDMGKAITQQKEEDIKKAQGLLVKKAIAAALVFLIPSIAVALVGVVGSNDQGSLKACKKCIFDGETNVTDVSECSLTEANCSEGTTLDKDNCKCVIPE